MSSIASRFRLGRPRRQVRRDSARGRPRRCAQRLGQLACTSSGTSPPRQDRQRLRAASRSPDVRELVDAGRHQKALEAAHAGVDERLERPPRCPARRRPRTRRRRGIRPRAAARFASSAATVVVAGTLLSGMSTIVVTPPAAAARVAVSKPSHSVRPGSLTWTCVSTMPGKTTRSPHSTISAPGGVVVVAADRDDAAVLDVHGRRPFAAGKHDAPAADDAASSRARLTPEAAPAGSPRRAARYSAVERTSSIGAISSRAGSAARRRSTRPRRARPPCGAAARPSARRCRGRSAAPRPSRIDGRHDDLRDRLRRARAHLPEPLAALDRGNLDGDDQLVGPRATVRR